MSSAAACSPVSRGIATSSTARSTSATAPAPRPRRRRPPRPPPRGRARRRAPCRRPRRTIGWSSASRIRVFERNAHSVLRAPARRAHLGPAAGARRRPGGRPRAGRARACRRCRRRRRPLRRQTAAVVAHDQPHAAAVDLARATAATFAAPAWRITFVRLSWATRYTTSSTSGLSSASPRSRRRSTRRPGVAATVVHRRAQRALQAQVVERLEAAARGRCGERRRGCGAPPRGPGVLQPEHHAGEHLAHLVVQLARNPPAHLLLGGHHPAPTLAALVLQPVEHVVEGLGQGGHVGVGVREWTSRRPGSRGSTARIVSVEPAKRRDHRRSRSTLSASDTTKPDHEDHRLGARDGIADLDGGEQQQQRDHQEHGAVGEEDPGEEREPACAFICALEDAAWGRLPAEDGERPPWARRPFAGTIGAGNPRPGGQECPRESPPQHRFASTVMFMRPPSRPLPDD